MGLRTRMVLLMVLLMVPINFTPVHTTGTPGAVNPTKPYIQQYPVLEAKIEGQVSNHWAQEPSRRQRRLERLKKVWCLGSMLSSCPSASYR